MPMEHSWLPFVCLPLLPGRPCDRPQRRGLQAYEFRRRVYL